MAANIQANIQETQMGTLTCPQRHQPAAFTRLPAEIRLIIYKYLFISNTSRSVLRHPNELSSRLSRLGNVTSYTIEIFNISVLAACQKVYQEALPVFYSSWTFHYIVESAMPAPHLRTHLLLMKDISIGSCGGLDEPSWSSYTFDPYISIHVPFIAACCPALRTLALHVPRESTLSGYQTMRGHTASVLRDLAPRLEHLSIVTFGRADALKEFRNAIADEKYWVAATSRLAPQFALSDWLEEWTQRLEDQSVTTDVNVDTKDPAKAIRVWSLRGRKMARGQTSVDDEALRSGYSA